MRTTFTRKEHTESGLALILILLIVFLIWHAGVCIKLAVAIALLVMIIPATVYPFTFLWLNISDFLGKIISKILLAVIFGLFVIPVGLFRKMAGKDNLKLKLFKKSEESVFTNREHEYIKEDLLHPF